MTENRQHGPTIYQGAMFWFIRKKFVGSYFRSRARSRSYFGPPLTPVPVRPYRQAALGGTARGGPSSGYGMAAPRPRSPPRANAEGGG
jgi:hypothetical protein